MRSSIWLLAVMVLTLEVSTQAGYAQGSTAGARAGQPSGQRAGAPPAQAAPAAAAKRSPGAGPVIVFETAKGSFEMETYPNEAPKSVAQIVTLAKRNFYNGLRVHRVVPGFVVQFGDPQTRDMTKRDSWGTRGSGREIGVAEINPKRPHRLGAVALAHAGDPRGADSQVYIALAGLDEPRIANINGDFTVIGQIISGLDVVQKLQVNDIIRRATVKEAAK
jgi:peptidyl-prolyl cis-trans isomerase B (cyclophilin B)